MDLTNKNYYARAPPRVRSGSTLIARRSPLSTLVLSRCAEYTSRARAARLRITPHAGGVGAAPRAARRAPRATRPGAPRGPSRSFRFVQPPRRAARPCASRGAAAPPPPPSRPVQTCPASCGAPTAAAAATPSIFSHWVQDDVVIPCRRTRDSERSIDLFSGCAPAWPNAGAALYPGPPPIAGLGGEPAAALWLDRLSRAPTAVGSRAAWVPAPISVISSSFS